MTCEDPSTPLNDDAGRIEPDQDASASQSPDLEVLRRHIDEIDKKLIAILTERARVVEGIGTTKRDDGTPIYAPHREKQVIDRVITLNEGPLPDRTIEAIYRELMSGSFCLELPLRVGYLGPPGSFSHVAATRHFGSSIEFDDLHEIEHVFEEVAAKRCHYGFVPYENSIGGGVIDTLDAFQDHQVTIYAEALLEVSQTLLANCLPNEIKCIYSKPQVFSQCRRWLSKHFPNVTRIPTSSTSNAVEKASTEPHTAAIGSTLAGEIYGVKPIFDRIQDKPNNITRFLIIGMDTALPTGNDKTSIMFVTNHKPGALVDVLAVFREYKINLSHIEKRPSGRTNWEYTFFIDAEAHRSEEHMTQAINDAHQHCLSLSVLGSYPRASSVL